MIKTKLIVILIIFILATTTQAVNGVNKKKNDKSVQSQVKKNVVTPTQNILVDDDVWPYFNWAAFDQDKIISYGNYQYSVSWDHHCNKLHYTKSKKGFLTNPPAKISIADFEPAQPLVSCITNKVKFDWPDLDGELFRNLTCIPSVCALISGRLYAKRDQPYKAIVFRRPTTTKYHADDQHRLSYLAALVHPEYNRQISPYLRYRTLAAGAPQIVTYPRFFNDSNDELFFVYRTGWSGFGDSIISSYSSKKGKWNVIGCFLGQKGTFKPWNNSTNRNAYLNDVLFDKNNRLHITWLYREEAAGYGNNHDLHYAYSDDSGITWMNNDGKKIADLSKKDPILISDPGIIVEKIPIYSWIINQCAMTIDSKNRPHVSIYKLPDPQKNPTIFPSPDLKEQQCFYHYWRDSDGKWHNSGPLEVPKGLSISRPNIVVDSNDNIIIYWVSNKGLCYYLAKADEKWKTWVLCSLTDESFTCNDLPKHDRRLLKNKGILSFTVDPKGKKEGCGYTILDFNIKDLVAYAQKKI